MRGAVRKGKGRRLDHPAGRQEVRRRCRTTVRERRLAPWKEVRARTRCFQARRYVSPVWVLPNPSNSFPSCADGKHLGPASHYSESDTVFESLDMTPEVRSELLSTIARRLTPKPVKVRSDLELTCYSYEGINGIKAALRAGEALSTEQVPIKIRLVAPPLYVMSTTSTDKNAAIELMEQALSKIGEEIEKYEGNINVAMRVSRTSDSTWMDSPLKTDARSSILFMSCAPAQGRLRRRGRCSRPAHGAGRERERPGLGRRG